MSLNRLKNLQKLSVYGKSPHKANIGKACILHYGMSRQKQIANYLTLANIPESTRALKNNYGPFNILPVLSKLFERLLSKQLA